MKIVKDWIYAIKVCKKYNIRWNPFFFSMVQQNLISHITNIIRNGKVLSGFIHFIVDFLIASYTRLGIVLV